MPLKNFNPRTHRGVRLAYVCRSLALQRFQSTHPSWGATHYIKATAWSCSRDFNPRTHRGVRQTMERTKATAGFENFNPRTHRGVRPQK